MTNRQVLRNFAHAVDDVIISLRRMEFGRPDLKSVVVDLDRLGTVLKDVWRVVQSGQSKPDRPTAGDGGNDLI